jgi:methionyl-tRNA formyltransferase
MRVNYHDSLLPNHAGYHATTWSIMSSTPTHGVTWHVLDGPIDSGGLLVQRAITVADDETAFSLNMKCFEASVESFTDLVCQFEDETVQPRPQDLASRTFHRLQARPSGAGVIDWRLGAREISRVFRAIDFGPTPNPLAAAKTLFGSSAVRVDALAATSTRTEGEPGTIVAVDGDVMRVTTGDLDVEITISSFSDASGAAQDGPTTSNFEVGQRLRWGKDFEALVQMRRI